MEDLLNTSNLPLLGIVLLLLILNVIMILQDFYSSFQLTLIDELGKSGSREIESIFDEDPSLEEAKEAFDMFDENNDGVIDAGELLKVLCTFGFVEISEFECRKMIKTFDRNRDGMIDFQEFIKLLEECDAQRI
ncbi:hypothetical protein ACFE04_010803 [Oxalis oulophora]